MKIIGFTGKAGAGKDTAAKMLVGSWESFGPDKHAVVTKFATPIHYIINYLYGTFDEFQPEVDFETAKRTGVKMPGSDRTVREAMQTLGTEWGRQIMGPDYWINLWKLNVEKVGAAYKDADLLVIVSDVRFQNEVNVIHKLGGYVVRIDRDYNEGVGLHASEQIDGLLVDHILDNTGTLRELKQRVRRLSDYLAHER